MLVVLVFVLDAYRARARDSHRARALLDRCLRHDLRALASNTVREGEVEGAEDGGGVMKLPGPERVLLDPIPNSGSGGIGDLHSSPEHGGDGSGGGGVPPMRES